MWPHNVQMDTMRRKRGGEQDNDKAGILSRQFVKSSVWDVECELASILLLFWLFKWLASMTGTVYPSTAPVAITRLYSSKAVSVRRLSLSRDLH